jgi:transcriptional regulator with XRE-family HTH domain
MGFGSTLRRLREAVGLSQAELAERAGISVDSIQNWEQGRSSPRLEALPVLATALNVDVASLIADVSAPETKRPRGRPAKPKPTEPNTKRPRGRPRKSND